MLSVAEGNQILIDIPVAHLTKKIESDEYRRGKYCCLFVQFCEKIYGLFYLGVIQAVHILRDRDFCQKESYPTVLISGSTRQLDQISSVRHLKKNLQCQKNDFVCCKTDKISFFFEGGAILDNFRHSVQSVVGWHLGVAFLVVIFPMKSGLAFWGYFLGGGHVVTLWVPPDLSDPLDISTMPT